MEGQQQAQQPTLNLALQTQQVQYLLSVLAKRPYEEAAEIISTIVNQANQQAQAQQPMQDAQPPQKPAKVTRTRKAKTNGTGKPQPTMQ